MKHLPAIAALAALVGATACGQQAPTMTPSPATPPAAAAPAAACNADAAQFAVGQLLDTALTEQARARSGAQRVRAVRPGEMVTMEFDEQRLTLQLDAAGRVAAARCG